MVFLTYTATDAMYVNTSEIYGITGMTGNLEEFTKNKTG